MSAPRDSATEAPRVSSLTGVRALLVDDEHDTRELTARVLRKAGAEVVAVSDAEAALARIDADRFDLVVSDLMMPGTDGWELARLVRSRYGHALPLLAVTGLDGVEDRQRARDAGFDAYFTKPLEEGTLVKVRDDLLCTRRALGGAIPA